MLHHLQNYAAKGVTMWGELEVRGRKCSWPVSVYYFGIPMEELECWRKKLLRIVYTELEN